MVPVPTEDFELDPPGGFFWQSLLNLAISVLVVCAAALIGSFLSATSVHARTVQETSARSQPVPAVDRAAFESRNVDVVVLAKP
jgi:hypothetical protein